MAYNNPRTSLRPKRLIRRYINRNNIFLDARDLISQIMYKMGPYLGKKCVIFAIFNFLICKIKYHIKKYN